MSEFKLSFPEHFLSIYPRGFYAENMLENRYDGFSLYSDNFSKGFPSCNVVTVIDEPRYSRIQASSLNQSYREYGV